MQTVACREPHVRFGGGVFSSMIAEVGFLDDYARNPHFPEEFHTLEREAQPFIEVCRNQGTL
jgi:hypothetical protein